MSLHLSNTEAQKKSILLKKFGDSVAGLGEKYPRLGEWVQLMTDSLAMSEVFCFSFALFEKKKEVDEGPKDSLIS